MKIKNIDGLPAAELQKAVKDRGRFVYFACTISLLIITLRDTSGVYLIRSGENSIRKSFLFTVAYNHMIDHIRKNKRIVLKEEFNESVRTTNRQQHDSKKILNEALNRLNETQRSLVMLKDYEGYSYEEIGKITGLNESQVKVYLHRARLQLREYIVKPENVI